MGLIVRTTVQKRFNDIDPFRHVNNTAQYSYLDLGKMEFFRLLGADDVTRGISAVTVSAYTDFMSQIDFEDEIEIVTEVEAVGNKSITLQQRIERSNGEVCTRCRAVLVAFEVRSRTSVEIPDAWRKVLKEAE